MNKPNIRFERGRIFSRNFALVSGLYLIVSLASRDWPATLRMRRRRQIAALRDFASQICRA
jgi:hypothetical protein